MKKFKIKSKVSIPTEVKQSLLREEITRGNITVEAAYVMPVILFTVFALIFLAFYLHDRNVIYGEMDKSLHRTSFQIKHIADLSSGKIYYEKINDRGVFYQINPDTEQEEKQLITYITRELSHRLFLYKITSVQAEISRTNISLGITASRTVRLSLFPRIFDSVQRMTFNSDTSIHNPAETIRYTEVVLDTASNVKGVDKLREKLEKFINKIR